MTQIGTLITGLALSAALLLSSCGNNPPPPLAAPPPAPTPAMNAETAPSLEEETMPAQTPAALAGDQGATEVRLNPAHGEPGHRCEIPVGAPLDGSPAPGGQSITIPPVEAAPSPATLPITMPPTNTAGKINPPHGEPGHDCAVPVGSPLPG